MTREERAYKRLHSRPRPNPDPIPNPRRILEVTGESLSSPAHCVWEQKHGLWFMMKSDPRLKGWMADRTGVLCEPSMQRFCRFQNLKWRWLP